MEELRVPTPQVKERLSGLATQRWSGCAAACCLDPDCEGFDGQLLIRSGRIKPDTSGCRRPQIRATPLFEGAPPPVSASSEQELKKRPMNDGKAPQAPQYRGRLHRPWKCRHSRPFARLRGDRHQTLGATYSNTGLCRGHHYMGDGRIALILDVSNIARMAGLTSLDGSERAAELAEAAKEAITDRDKQTLLTFSSSGVVLVAVPLNQVEQVEKIKQHDIEEIGRRQVMQYRGDSLPLISIDEVASVMRWTTKICWKSSCSILQARIVGLLAIGPIDAIEISADIDDVTLKATRHHGVGDHWLGLKNLPCW